MRKYLIFHYEMDGQEYVEAYPIHDWDTEVTLDAIMSKAPIFNKTRIRAESRNQARKKAYCLWIKASGRDFNKFPYRPYAKAKRVKAQTPTGGSPVSGNPLR